MKSNIYKKHDRDTTANDLNPGCRRIIANTKARRNLKKKLRRKLRKTIDRIVESESEEDNKNARASNFTFN